MSRRGRPVGGSALCLLLIAAAACARHATPVGGTAIADLAAPTATALTVDSAMVSMSRFPLWPGFAPLSTPVAVFDGTRTFLFRHPSPPVGYAAFDGRRDVVVRDGRDAAITANTSAPLGGLVTATVMLDPRSRVQDAAALTIHEIFHVFQRTRHPSWIANEADLFTYPVELADALALRREETSALRTALASRSGDSLRCWSRSLLAARRARFALIGREAAAYERGTELNEGLARYVELRALGYRVALPDRDYPADQPRQRAYEVGAGIGQLLDRLRSSWRDTLDAASSSATPSLDALLASALQAAAPGGPCGDGHGAERVATAEADVRTLGERRRRTRAEFLSTPGWSFVIEAPTDPLFPQGFDPLNVSRLSPTEILHSRFLKLQGSHGSIDLLSRPSLTEGVPGQHPLFNGVRRVTITGLPPATVVKDSAGVLIVDGPGLHGRLTGVRADTTGTTIRIGPR